MSVFADKVWRILAPAGSGAATLSANFAAGCVGLFAPLGTAITALGLDWLHVLDIQMPILYGASAISLLGLILSAWRHRWPFPLVLGVVSLGALFYPFHVVLDVPLFRLLTYGGAAGLLLAALWDAILLRRCRPGAGTSSGHGGRNEVVVQEG